MTSKTLNRLLHIALSNETFFQFIPQKTSREYISLNIFERKMAFLSNFKPKSVQNHPFFRCFNTFQAAWEHI
jgi:hypothetical protein